jgi:Ca-activated chloride channel family protein
MTFPSAAAWFAFVALMGGASLGSAPAVSRAMSESPAQQQPILSARTDLVVLHVTVTDRKNRPVTDLPQAAFTVYENARPREITFFAREDVPATVGLVIDNSSSMTTRRERVIAAGLAFARSSHPDDDLFVVHFADAVRPAADESVEPTPDRTVLYRALAELRASGRTALYDGVLAGLRHLEAGRHRKKALVVLSDGADNASRSSFHAVLDTARRSEAVIYAIGLFDEYAERNPDILRDLARATGGSAHFPDDPSDLEGVLREIAGQIRGAYTLAYVVTPSEAPDFRRVRVDVRAPGRGGLRARTRDGYYAP